MKNQILIISLLIVPFFTTAQGDWKYITKKDGLLSNKVRGSLADQSGNVWFFTDKGMSQFDGEKWSNYENHILATSSKFQAFEDSKGNIWFWLKDIQNILSLAMFDGKNFSYQNELGLKCTKIKVITEDSKGRIWIGGSRIALLENNEWHYFNTKGLVTNLYEDTKENMWITSHLQTPTNGYIYKTNSDALLTPDNEDILLGSEIPGLPNSTIILEDSLGNIWINGYWGEYTVTLHTRTAGGIIQLNGDDWKHHDVDLGMSYAIIEEDKTSLLVFSHRDTYMYKEGKWIKAWRMGKINSTLKVNGAIWVGLGFGIGKYENSKWKYFRPSEGFGGVNVIFKDSRGTLWFGGDNVYMLKNNEWGMENGKPGLIKLQDVNNIIEDKAGNIWISTKKGVVRYTE